MTTTFEDHAKFFDHDPSACAICRPKNDYWLDCPCPECGHTFDRAATTYFAYGSTRNLKTEWCLCFRCKLALHVYSGDSVFAFDVTGPGADLRDYRAFSEA